MGAGTTLLVDTYDIEEAVRLGVRLAGPELGAVRIDSGDLPIVVDQVRRLLDELGATSTRITVTNDLDEHAVAALAASPVDSYGVGTSVVTGSGSPAMGMVYKLVAHRDDQGDWISVAKKSAEKATVGGRKTAARAYDRHGVAREERIYLGDGPAGEHEGAADAASERPLMVQLVEGGLVDEQYLGAAGTRQAREHRAQAVAELPPRAVSLTRGDPVLPTVYLEG
jgi:nicotinate phosphoribosyltransferase